jgi:hypothetical protein
MPPGASDGEAAPSDDPGEQTEPIVQARCEVLYTERRAAGRRQLDRQRDAVESPADCRCDSGGAPVRREVRIRRPRSCYEQLNRAVSQQLIHIVGTFSRHGERWHPIQLLSFHSQRLTTSRQHSYRRIGVQKHFGHAGRCVDHMLAIVDHEHQLLPAERIRDTFGRHSARGELETERCGHGDRNKLGIGDRREFGDPGSIGKFRQKTPRDLDTEVRLADPSLTRQRDEPMLRYESRHLGELCLSADQFRNGYAQALAAALHAAAHDFRAKCFDFGGARGAVIDLVRHPGKAQAFEDAFALAPVDRAYSVERNGRALRGKTADCHFRFDRGVFRQVQPSALDITRERLGRRQPRLAAEIARIAVHRLSQ